MLSVEGEQGFRASDSGVLCLFPAPFSSTRVGEDKTGVGFDSSRIFQVSKPKREVGREQREGHMPSSDNKVWLRSFTRVRGEWRVRLREPACACQGGERVGRTDWSVSLEDASYCVDKG